MSKLKAKDPKQAVPAKPKILIFGSYGTSKTWGSLSFPNAYFIDTEGGANLPQYTDRLKSSGGRYMGPEDGACDLVEIIEQVKALTTEKHEYKTLIIDSITKPFHAAIQKEMERMEKAGEKDGFGASKKPAVKLIKRLMVWINDRLDMNVIIIAREKSKWSKGEQVDYDADVHEDVSYDLNLVLRISKEKEARIATVTKTRLSPFPDQDVFVWSASPDKSDKSALNEFVKRLGSGIMDESKPVELATSEQVTEIQKLLEVIKTTDAEKEKILDKAGAESWYELTTEQAAATIKWLNGKLK
jgi:hypothetical protein